MSPDSGPRGDYWHGQHRHPQRGISAYTPGASPATPARAFLVKVMLPLAGTIRILSGNQDTWSSATAASDLSKTIISYLNCSPAALPFDCFFPHLESSPGVLATASLANSTFAHTKRRVLRATEVRPPPKKLATQTVVCCTTGSTAQLRFGKRREVQASSAEKSEDIKAAGTRNNGRGWVDLEIQDVKAP